MGSWGARRPSLAAYVAVTGERELGDVRRLLGQYTPRARQMPRKLLDGQKITLTPVEVDGSRGYRFTGSGTYLRLLPSDRLPRTVVAPTGFEPVFGRGHVFTSSVA
jgi:hypothetical protein